MKPTKLTMSAFGSYADTQTIDFDELGASGLYLITGETGSGKTTIFDAVSFALFGEPSGNSRDGKMLRSDFADEKAKTYVELEFISGGNAYKVHRKLKSSGWDAELLLPDGTSVIKTREVNGKINETVGLDRDQFAQIVMIAQNDFLRFLQSGTDERLKILRRIFGTETLKQFQERLKARVKRESEKRDIVIHDFDRCGVNVYEREKRFAEWETQIAADNSELSEANKKLTKLDKQKQELAAALAMAESVAKLFADLMRSRAELETHRAKAAETAALKSTVERGETALRKVKPLADAAAKAIGARGKAAENLENAKKEEASAVAESEAVQKAVAELPPLDAVKQTFAALEKEVDSAEEKEKKLVRLDKAHRATAGKQRELSALQSDYMKLDVEYKTASEKFELIDSAFLAAQAGLLAKTLESGKPCPVCGSTEHPAPAALGDSHATEDLRKKAKKAADIARDRRDAKSAECGKLSSEIDTLKTTFLADVSAYIAEPTWDTVESELSELLAKAKRETAELGLRKRKDKKSLDELVLNWDTATARKAKAAEARSAAAALTQERAANEKALSESADAAVTAYAEALGVNGFADEEEYKSALISEETLTADSKKLADYENRGNELTRDTARLETETSDKTPPDLEELKEQSESAGGRYKALSKNRDEIKSRLDKTGAALAELRKAATDFENVEKTYSAVKQLADTANGRLDFETHAQISYFKRVLNAANLRLKLMSQNRYALLRKEEIGDKRVRTGLDIEVLDSYTGKARSANSLSGGESFMASLSLALGLSDVVQQSAGGIHLDAMFIDEGFGSLDAEVLELAVRTLSEMAGTNRIIGIISHVAELRERIDRQVQVEKTPVGSKITVAV
jgi:exonuclease SbcC